MPICTHCGEFNPDSAALCSKCGFRLGHQIRAVADAKRGQAMSVIRIVVWIAVVIALVVIAPPAYHAGAAAYYKHHLESITAKAMSDCNGPVTDATPAYQRDQINLCLAGNTDLIQAQKDYASFDTSPSKKSP